MSSNIDPLVNSRIRNKLLLSDAQSYLPTGTTGNSADDIDNILDKTTIKRACCSNTSNVNVKLPIYPNISFDEFTGGGVIEQKFGFINKTINVPTSSCPTGYNTGTETGTSCDTFYSLYCSNARKVYKDKKTSLGETLDLEEFKLYSPDCATINIVAADWPTMNAQTTGSTGATGSTGSTGSTDATDATDATESMWETQETPITPITPETQETPITPETQETPITRITPIIVTAAAMPSAEIYENNSSNTTLIIIIIAIVLILILIVVFIIIFSSSKNKSKQVGGSFINNNLFYLKNWVSQII